MAAFDRDTTQDLTQSMRAAICQQSREQHQATQATHEGPAGVPFSQTDPARPCRPARLPGTVNQEQARGFACLVRIHALQVESSMSLSGLH